MTSFFVLLLLFFSIHFPSHAFNFDAYQGKLTKEEVTKKLNKYLIKDPSIHEYIQMSEEAFVLYDSPESKANGKEEWRLQFALKPTESSPAKKHLNGAKIALDPGHFGGSYAYLEARFVDMQDNIHLEEGTLTLLTAIYLKELLEKEGAEVMLTKTELGEGAISLDFFDWLKENPHLWRTKKALSQLFRDEYNGLDLKERAKKINAFAPDLTLIIHYNAHDSSDPASPFTKASDKNFNMTFIPGAFCQNELKTPEAREKFVRLIVTQDLENSSRLSKCVMDAFTSHLKIPHVTEIDGARYLENVCLKIQEGVYARNLALTRLVSGPLCYGETLVQNNPEEAKRLATKDTSIADIPCSSRVKEVAEAYFEAVRTYFENESLVNKAMISSSPCATAN